MIKYCKECKYAEPNLTIAHALCTNKTMPPWFNVIVFEGRVACNKFEEKVCEKELTQKLQIKQMKEEMEQYRMTVQIPRSKYHARKVTVDGIKFDSKAEAKRYAELLLLQKAGIISNLQRQVEFELIPAQKIDEKHAERAVKYKADFVYVENGKRVVEDVKGVKTKEYIIKRKLMLYVHKIAIKETITNMSFCPNCSADMRGENQK